MAHKGHNEERSWSFQTAEGTSGLRRKFVCESDDNVEFESLARELPCFANLSLGATIGTHRESGTEFFQFNSDRYRHTIILGRTGAGKSNHIQQLEREDIRSGAGVFILAAHEDDALYPLSCVPEERLDDVVLIDASNPEYLPRMNPFDVDASNRGALDRAVENILELVTMDSEYSWAGPRFEHYLRNAAELLLSYPAPSAHCVNDLNKAFTDPEFVKGLLKYVTNKEVYDFWTKVFPQAQKSNDSGEVNGWVLAKMSRYATDHVLGHFFGAGSSTIDIQSVVDDGKILIAYVPESRIGAIAARTICKWLVMQLRDAIMNRRVRAGGWRGLNYCLYEDDPTSPHADDIDPFFVYIDEFSKFATTDFESLLAEARKQNVGFVLSTQTFSQARIYDRKSGHTTDKLQASILGNVGSMICYPVGVHDAELLSRQFDVDVEKLKRIERYQPLARLCVDNQIGRPGTLAVALRPVPDNPTAARRIAKNQIRSGAWVRVQAAIAKVSPRRPADGPSGKRAPWLDSGMKLDCPENGIGLAYRYMNPVTGTYDFTFDPMRASCVAGDDHAPVWVRYRDGLIDRPATAEEYQEELEVRIGTCISEGLSKQELDEFDAITDQAEAVCWLEKVYPDFRSAVSAVTEEMRKAYLLDGDDLVKPK